MFNFYVWNNLLISCYIMILHRLGGHLDNSDVMLGNITDFNMWDKSLTEKETER